jgi:hypothetical protein
MWSPFILCGLFVNGPVCIGRLYSGLNALTSVLKARLKLVSSQTPVCIGRLYSGLPSVCEWAERAFEAKQIAQTCVLAARRRLFLSQTLVHIEHHCSGLSTDAQLRVCNTPYYRRVIADAP